MNIGKIDFKTLKIVAFKILIQSKFKNKKEFFNVFNFNSMAKNEMIITGINTPYSPPTPSRCP
jgi:hypothetical protein